MKIHVTCGPGYLRSDLLFPFQTSEWSLLVHAAGSYFLLHSLQASSEAQAETSQVETWF